MSSPKIMFRLHFPDSFDHILCPLSCLEIFPRNCVKCSFLLGCVNVDHRHCCNSKSTWSSERTALAASSTGQQTPLLSTNLCTKALYIMCERIFCVVSSTRRLCWTLCRFSASWLVFHDPTLVVLIHARDIVIYRQLAHEPVLGTMTGFKRVILDPLPLFFQDDRVQ